MSTRRFWLIAGVGLFVVILGLVIRNQVKVYVARQARDAVIERRQALFDLVQPVAIGNCQLERYGETNDGGYLMCANLLGEIESGYSYGIAGYDKWGCDISTNTAWPSTSTTASTPTSRRVRTAGPFFTRNAWATRPGPPTRARSTRSAISSRKTATRQSASC